MYMTDDALTNQAKLGIKKTGNYFFDQFDLNSA